MSFVDDVHVWLRDGRQQPEYVLLPDGFDLPARHAVVWTALAVAGEQEQDRWSSPDRIDRFVRATVFLLRQGIGASWPMNRLTAIVDRAIVRAIVPTTQRFEGPDRAERLLDREVTRIAAHGTQMAFGDRVNVATWCVAVGATQDGELTAIGRVLLRLVGREAVVFVLELEQMLSTGPLDEHRVPRSVLTALRGGRIVFGDPLEIQPSISRTALTRLASMGVAVHTEHESVEGFALAPDAAALVDAVLDPSPNATRMLARALLDALRGRVSAEVTGVSPVGDDLGYARLVVHELRNRLFPLSTALDGLWNELGRPQAPDPALMARFRERIDRSVEQLTGFASDSARHVQLVAPEAFGLADVVAEAIRATDVDRNGRIAVLADPLDTVVEGPRPRWVYLFVNLFRNAAQVRQGTGSVWVSAERDSAGRVHVFVDDDGPGVPEELRERIFDVGVSTRGGTGFGLSDARTTARLTGGSLVCETSPRGGARFHATIPIRSVG